VSHELDVTEGVASFASHQAAWHRLGTVFDHEMTVEEALEAAHLARWNVRKLDLIGRDVQLATDGVTTVDVADTNWRLAVRTNPITGKVEPFGPVGRNFVRRSGPLGTRRAPRRRSRPRARAWTWRTSSTPSLSARPSA
jgi:hypothetical protein